jgi:hypothetical protein
MPAASTIHGILRHQKPPAKVHHPRPDLGQHGKAAPGTPKEVITEGYFSQTYGIASEVHVIQRRDGREARLCVPEV